jgi:hypothetical protein
LNQGFTKKCEKKLVRAFRLAYCYIDNGLSLNNSKFADSIYLIEHEIKEITDTTRPVSYIDIHIEVNNESLLKAKLYYKRDID